MKNTNTTTTLEEAKTRIEAEKQDKLLQALKGNLHNTSPLKKSFFDSKLEASSRQLHIFFISKCETLEEEAFRLVTCNDAKAYKTCEDNLFKALKSIFECFNKTTTVNIKCNASDIAVIASLATKYAKGEERKQWDYTSKSYFRKGIEDFIVDRVEATQHKTIEELQAEKKAKIEAKKKARAEEVKKVMKLLNCDEKTAKDTLKALHTVNKLEEVKASVTKQDTKLSKAYNKKVEEAKVEAEARAKAKTEAEAKTEEKSA